MNYTSTGDSETLKAQGWRNSFPSFFLGGGGRELTSDLKWGRSGDSCLFGKISPPPTPTGSAVPEAVTLITNLRTQTAGLVWFQGPELFIKSHLSPN